MSAESSTTQSPVPDLVVSDDDSTSDSDTEQIVSTLGKYSPPERVSFPSCSLSELPSADKHVYLTLEEKYYPQIIANATEIGPNDEKIVLKSWFTAEGPEINGVVNVSIKLHEWCGTCGPRPFDICKKYVLSNFPNRFAGHDGEPPTGPSICRLIDDSPYQLLCLV